MPGEFGDYTVEQVQAMSPEDLAAAASRGWKRAPSIVDVELPPPPAEPRPDVWATRKANRGKDFTCPSGQTCRLRPLDPEELLKGGILDRVTRLEGLAAELVDAAEGNPPALDKLPGKDELIQLIELMDVLIPLAVSIPQVYRNDDDDAPEGAIRVSDIDLDDRMAIMEESLKGLRALDAFRRPR